jgi:dihydropteroate synthase
MGILNITPDSFYAGSRKQTAEEIERRIEAILEEGGDMIDIGGYSSRPGAADIPEKQERERLAFALGIINRRCPGAVVSVDTFRAGIARYCVEEFGVAMINDISGGELDASMFETVADLQVPYVMMHMRGTPQTMQQHTGYGHLTGDIRRYFAEKVDQLRQMGVNDIILDPGFGFSKTLEQNYTLLRHLEDFEMFGLPLLVGVSRKGMIYKALGGTPEDSLNGTTALHTMALLNGADILRVHDVREAVEVAGLVAEYKKG